MTLVSSNLPRELARAREVLDAIEARTTPEMARAVNALAKTLVAAWVAGATQAATVDAVVREVERCRKAGLPAPSKSDTVNLAKAAISDIRDEQARRKKPHA
jgi:beta-lactamase regulating signal transducer with metallopeptidase domain